MNEPHLPYDGAAADRDRLQGLIGDDYRLQWVVGHGGMSTVWLADDPATDSEVAIKVLRPEYSNTPEFRERFRNEATAAMGIHSRNVVATFDYREVPDESGATFCFIVMEFIRGESLAARLAREGALPEDEALNIIEQAAHGLGAIHALGMVHRDIKPGNIMLTESGEAKIADFGIAKAAEAAPLTRTGMVVGTAQYVSPEQAQGMTLSPASDVYSLGIVAYEALSGTRPFGGDSSVSVVMAHINKQPAPLTTAISAPTRELVAIALRKDPHQRFATGNVFAESIGRVRLGQRPVDPRTQTRSVTAAQTTLYDDSPTPTAMLSQYQPAYPATQVPRTPQRVEPRRRSGAQTWAWGVLAAVVVALGALGVIWALQTGVIGSDETTNTTPTSSTAQTVTHTVTPTPSTTRTTSQRPTPTTSSVEPSPTSRPVPSTVEDTPVLPILPTRPELPTVVPTPTSANAPTQQAPTAAATPTAAERAPLGTNTTGGE